MSSYPQHKENMEKAKSLGIDVSEYDGEDYYESWGYDALTSFTTELLSEIERLRAELTNIKREKAE